MSHEQSETIQDEDGSWVNIYGRATAKAGQRLPGMPSYPDLASAVSAARSRSHAYGRELPVSPVYSEPMPNVPLWYEPSPVPMGPPMDDRTRQYMRDLLLRNLVKPEGQSLEQMPNKMPGTLDINLAPRAPSRTPLQRVLDTIPGMAGVRG